MAGINSFILMEITLMIKILILFNAAVVDLGHYFAPQLI